jgi:hypothetical protein
MPRPAFPKTLTAFQGALPRKMPAGGTSWSRGGRTDDRYPRSQYAEAYPLTPGDLLQRRA